MTTKFHSDFLYRCDPDFENLGFNRDNFMRLLNASGAATAGPEPTKWEQGLLLRQWFTIDEAACIICGRHPDEREDWWGEPWPRSVVSMRLAILDAWSELDIDTDGCGEVQNHHRVSHQSIKTWCEQRGINWPLSSVQPQATVVGTSSDIAQRLAAAEVRAERLTHELAAVAGERDQALKEVERLANDLIGAAKEAAASKAELATLQTQLDGQQDVLSTQGRNSALLIMAALAKEAKLDVSQPSRTGEILSSSVSELGCSLTGRAISTWLSDRRPPILSSTEL